MIPSAEGWLRSAAQPMCCSEIQDSPPLWGVTLPANQHRESQQSPGHVKMPTLRVHSICTQRERERQFKTAGESGSGWADFVFCRCWSLWCECTGSRGWAGFKEETSFKCWEIHWTALDLNSKDWTLYDWCCNSGMKLCSPCLWKKSERQRSCL